MHRLLAAVALLASLAQPAAGQDHADVEYATVGERRLLVDIYLPAGVDKPPLVVWVHGGAWRSGSKEDPPRAFVDMGFALASVDYRLSTEARFPALVHDIKGALRFLRANVARYGYDARRIAIAGSSAGGHLAALVGVTNGHPALEGEVGGHADISSDVQAIVDQFGPTNFLTILPQSTPHGLSVREPALELLLGDRPENVADLARLASPVEHVDPSAPPLLLMHGDQDPQVPINQSHELHAAYKRLGLPAHFEVVHGDAHGGPGFWDPERRAMIAQFLNSALRQPE